MDWLQIGTQWLEWEPHVRWWLYVFGFGGVIAWETFWPRKDRHEENLRNFGEMFTLWDRLLGTYQAQPAGGHEAMRVGLPGYGGGRTYNPLRLLAWPLWESAMGGPEGAETSPPVEAGVQAANAA